MTVQGAPVTALLFGLMITRNVQDAVLRPPVEGQSIDLVWDARLDSVSERFGQLKRRAEGTVSTRPPAAAPVMV